MCQVRAPVQGQLTIAPDQHLPDVATAELNPPPVILVRVRGHEVPQRRVDGSPAPRVVLVVLAKGFGGRPRPARQLTADSGHCGLVLCRTHSVPPRGKTTSITPGSRAPALGLITPRAGQARLTTLVTRSARSRSRFQ